MFDNWRCGYNEQLSMNIKICLFCHFILLFNAFKKPVNISVVIQPHLMLLTCRDKSELYLGKECIFLDFPMTNNSSFSPAALAHISKENQSLEILFPWDCSLEPCNVLFGRALKNIEVSSQL